MGNSITSFGTSLALLPLLGCTAVKPLNGTDSPDASSNSTCILSYSGPDASDDQSCVLTYFWQPVTGPQDCYCSPCPHALPASQAAAYEQQYDCFCGDRVSWMKARQTATYCLLDVNCAPVGCENSVVDASQPEASTQSAPDASVNAIVVENDPHCPASSSTLTSFRQPVTGPQDCYCLTCPVCFPPAQAFGNEQQYSQFCGLNWPAAYGCETVSCPPGASQ